MTNQPWRRCDFVDVLHQHLFLDQSQCLDILNALIALMTEELQQGTKIAIPNFGTFSLHHKKARIGRNPNSKQEVMIAARTTLSFRPSSLFRQHIRQRINNDVTINNQIISKT